MDDMTVNYKYDDYVPIPSFLKIKNPYSYLWRFDLPLSIVRS